MSFKCSVRSRADLDKHVWTTSLKNLRALFNLFLIEELEAVGEILDQFS